MIFIVVAMLPEGRPLIESLGMKRIPHETKYQIFGTDHCCLIVTGVGGLHAMAATTYLLTRFDAKKTDILLSAGICAAYFPKAGEKETYGSVYLARSIHNTVFQRSYYPDLLYKNPFDEADVFTVPHIYHKGKKGEGNYPEEYGQMFLDVKNGAKPMLVEMEAAFVYEAAVSFIYQHNLFILKIVSDFGDTENLTKQSIQSLMADKADIIAGFINQIRTMETDTRGLMRSGPLDPYEKELLEKIISSLRLTQYQQNEILRLAQRSLLRKKDLRAIMEGVPDIKTKTRKEGKELYGQLFKQLMEP